MNKNVIAFFKRHPDAKAAYLVNIFVFSKIELAERKKKFINAKKVSIITREEYEVWKEKKLKNDF